MADFWMMMANECGLGLGIGLIAATAITRFAFAPNILYSVSLKSFQFFSLANYGNQNEDALA